MDNSRQKEHCFRMMHKIYQMINQPELCDISIVVESKIYWVHRCFLVAACPTLQGIINDAEAAPKGDLQLTLQGLTCKGFEALLEYIYIGSLPLQKNQLHEDFKRACQALGVSEIPSNDTVTGGVFASMTGLHDSDGIVVVEVVTFPTNNGDFDADITKENLLSGVVEDRKVCGLQSESLHQDLKSTGRDLLDFCNQPIETVQFQNHNFACDIDGVSQHVHEITMKSDKEMDLLDISALFSVTKRNGKAECAPGDNDGVILQEEAEVIQVENCEVLVKNKNNPRRPRGRPRLANDHIFPLKPPYACPYQSCSKVCDSREKLKKHYRNHEEKKHECDMCGKKFLYKKDVIIHRRIHTGEKPYECATCGMCFTQKSVLVNHIQTHERGKKFSCLHCDKSYTSVRSLDSHVREKHSNPNASKLCCVICGGANVLDDGSVISRVCMNCVNGQKFACPFCDESFVLPRLLEAHVREKHSSPINGKPICGVCGETYYNDGPYLMHKENDCDNAHHLCLKCGLQFDQKPSFQSHINECANQFSRVKRRSHMADWKCALCEMPFSGKKSAMSHVQFSHDIYPVNDGHVISVYSNMDEESHPKVRLIDFSEAMFEGFCDSKKS